MNSGLSSELKATLPIFYAKLCVLEVAAAVSPVARQPLVRRRDHRRQRLAKLPGQLRALADFEKHLGTLSAASVCIDCGANVGKITQILADTGAVVHAFEPDPWAFSMLQKRFAAAPNVILHNQAVGDRAGSMFVKRAPGFDQNPAHYSIGSRVVAEPDAQAIEVAQIDFLAFVDSLARPVSLVKMDIEGAEVAVIERLLESQTLQRIEKLYVETHEQFGGEMAQRTAALRARVASRPDDRLCLDWI